MKTLFLINVLFLLGLAGCAHNYHGKHGKHYHHAKGHHCSGKKGASTCGQKICHHNRGEKGHHCSGKKDASTCGHKVCHHNRGNGVEEKKLPSGRVLKSYKSKVFLGGHPGKQDYKTLKDWEVAAVINLSEDRELKDLGFNPAEQAAKQGMAYHHIPMSREGEIKEEVLKNIEKTFMKYHSSGKKVLVHCKTSGNRPAVWFGYHFFATHGDRGNYKGKGYCKQRRCKKSCHSSGGGKKMKAVRKAERYGLVDESLKERFETFLKSLKKRNEKK